MALEEPARLGCMLVIARGVEREVRRRRALRLEAVVLGQAVELRPRDVRLAGLDRVEDPERFEWITNLAPLSLLG